MIRNFFRHLLMRRHYWRHVGFDELSELYVSSMFRSVALSLVGIFAPLFLLQEGYMLHSILFFYGCLFAARAVMDVIAGYIVAQWGPKHTILLSNSLQIIASAMFLTLPWMHWPLWGIGVIWGAALSLFFIAYHVDFSKIKHSEHGGKELGWMNIMERGGRAVGPIIGGLVATFFGAEYTFLAATAMLIIGLIPLFLSAEAVKTKQKLDFKGLPPRQLKRNIVSFAAATTENTICTVVWPLFMGLFVLSGYVYAELGFLSSISMFVSVIAAYSIGRLIDNHKGRPLLRASASASAVIHLFRPFVGTVPMALGVNVVHEVAAIGYWMPFYKGVYDTADSWTGRRIVFIVTLECVGEICKAIIFFGLGLLSLYISPKATLSIAFGVAAVASLLIMTERFRALDPWWKFYLDKVPGYKPKH